MGLCFFTFSKLLFIKVKDHLHFKILSIVHVFTVSQDIDFNHKIYPIHFHLENSQ